MCIDPNLFELERSPVMVHFDQKSASPVSLSDAALARKADKTELLLCLAAVFGGMKFMVEHCYQLGPLCIFVRKILMKAWPS